MPTAVPPASAAGVGLGYGIAIAVSILILISTIMLASYACIRVKGGGSGSNRSNNGDDNIDGHIYRFNHSFAAGSGSSEQVMVVGLGLAEPVIKSYPKMGIGESRRLPKPNNGPCTICLSDYQPKDSIRCIPGCHHCFHADCIDQWMKMTATCPLCRYSPTPSAGSTPVTTPLSELVPLSFHSR